MSPRDWHYRKAFKQKKTLLYKTLNILKQNKTKTENTKRIKRAENVDYKVNIKKNIFVFFKVMVKYLRQK